LPPVQNEEDSDRARNTPASPIRRLSPLAAAARSRGTNVIPLTIGPPDIPSPDSYIAAPRQFQQPVIAYEASRGKNTLWNNLAAYMNRSLNLSLRSEQFLITIGASEALIFLFMICADPGDEILVFDPAYVNYIRFAATAGVTLRPVLCAPEDGFHLTDTAAIRQKISRRTKALLLCNPNNPTGTVKLVERLKALISLAHEQGSFSYCR
jgi:aspartate aminotransferase